MNDSKGRYLLSIEPIPTTDQTATSPGSPSASPRSALPAYFVGSTAPNNVEDGVQKVTNPEPTIQAIAEFLSHQDQPEILIAIHGYNTGLGDFANPQDSRDRGSGVKGWYQQIRDHIEDHCDHRSPGLVLLGYRWPSEQVQGLGNDSLGHKLWHAHASLPNVLTMLSALAVSVFVGLIIVSTVTSLPGTVSFSIVGITLLLLAAITISMVFTLYLLRVVGYFRDSYRANHFGVPDLVELIRQLDKAMVDLNPDLNGSGRRIKLSFIGHSMGGFVVTNTVRILSDVFDRESIGRTSMSASKAKCPSPNVGNVFSLGRLVLVSPDIPAETIISGRANFLSSSLRRFEETYLFSNEGDMALKLASTAANYFSFPANTRMGGYRLGNVVVREPVQNSIARSCRYGIVNLELLEGQSSKGPSRSPHQGLESASPKPSAEDKPEDGVRAPSFLNYLYILPQTSLLERQKTILEPEQKPIAELFTVFDCTDYCEVYPCRENGPLQKMGVLTRALGKTSLNFWNYIGLTVDYLTGKIDTHGGYFHLGDAYDALRRQKRWTRPEAQLSTQLIYGLACLGFKSFLESLASRPAIASQPAFEPFKESLLAAENLSLEQRAIALKALSALCEDRGIQVLLSPERYQQDIRDIRTESDRAGY